jgi:hypothetical protein
MKTFREFCKEAYDADLMRSSTIRKGGEGGRIGRERRQDPQQTRRVKAVGGGKTEPVVQKPRKDIGKDRPKAKVTARQEQPQQERGSADVKAKAAAAAKEERRKAALARRAAKSGGGEAKKSTTSSKDLSKQADKLLAKKKEEPKKTESKPRRQWRTAEGGRMTRQERDKARNAEKTAAAQKTKKSSTEILAKMRKEYEAGGGKWNSKVAVQMRAKAKKAAQALGN